MSQPNTLNQITQKIDYIIQLLTADRYREDTYDHDHKVYSDYDERYSVDQIISDDSLLDYYYPVNLNSNLADNHNSPSLDCRILKTKRDVLIHSKLTQTDTELVIEKLSQVESFVTEYFSCNSKDCLLNSPNDNDCSINLNEISGSERKDSLLDGINNVKNVGQEALKHIGIKQDLTKSEKSYRNDISDIAEGLKLSNTSVSDQINCEAADSLEYYKSESIIYTADDFTDLIDSFDVDLDVNESLVDQRVEFLGGELEHLKIDFNDINLVIIASNTPLMENDECDCIFEDSIRPHKLGMSGRNTPNIIEGSNQFININQNHRKIVILNSEEKRRSAIEFNPKLLTTSIEAYLDELRLLIDNSFSSSSNYSDEYQLKLNQGEEKKNENGYTTESSNQTIEDKVRTSSELSSVIGSKQIIPRRPVDYKTAIMEIPYHNHEYSGKVFINSKKIELDESIVKIPSNIIEVNDFNMNIQSEPSDDCIKFVVDQAEVSDCDLDVSIGLAKQVFMDLLSGADKIPLDASNMNNNSIQQPTNFSNSCFENPKSQIDYSNMNTKLSPDVIESNYSDTKCRSLKKKFKDYDSSTDETEGSVAYISQKISFKVNLDNTNDSIHFVSSFEGNNQEKMKSNEKGRDILEDNPTFDKNEILNESGDLIVSCDSIMDETESSILFESCFSDIQNDLADTSVLVEDSDLLDETESSIVFESCFDDSLDDTRDNIDESDIHFVSCLGVTIDQLKPIGKNKMENAITTDKRYSLVLDRFSESEVSLSAGKPIFTNSLSKMSTNKSIESFSSSNSTSFNEPTEYHEADSIDSDKTVKDQLQTLSFQIPPNPKKPEVEDTLQNTDQRLELLFQTPPESKKPVIKTPSRHSYSETPVSPFGNSSYKGSVDLKDRSRRGSYDSIQTTPNRFRFDYDKTSVGNVYKRSVDPKHPLPPLPSSFRRSGENFLKGKNWIRKVFSLN